MDGLRISFFGSSLLSAYRNSAATYWRGIIKALHARGHRITFYESDVPDRRQHRDIEPPDWARVVVYSSGDEKSIYEALEDTKAADILIKCSGAGAFDELLETRVPDWRTPAMLAIFWDVDAPATLDRLRSDPADPFREQIPRYDAILTCGGGDLVVKRYLDFGAKRCVPIYSAFDPDTHHPGPADPRFEADLALMADRLPDREARVEEFFLRAAELLPDRTFLLGGDGWQDKPMPRNVKYVGPVHTNDHNAFNCTPRSVLNIHRESAAGFGYSPATRVFEAAGAGACLITDAFEGVQDFLEPGSQILVARDGREVAEHVRSLTPERARQIGEAARRRVLDAHTYAHRAEQLDTLFARLRATPQRV